MGINVLSLFLDYFEDMAKKTNSPFDDMAVEALRAFLESDILARILEHWMNGGEESLLDFSDWKADGAPPTAEAVAKELEAVGMTPEHVASLHRSLQGS